MLQQMVHAIIDIAVGHDYDGTCTCTFHVLTYTKGIGITGWKTLKLYRDSHNYWPFSAGVSYSSARVNNRGSLSMTPRSSVRRLRNVYDIWPLQRTSQFCAHTKNQVYIHIQRTLLISQHGDWLSKKTRIQTSRRCHAWRGSCTKFKNNHTHPQKYMHHTEIPTTIDPSATINYSSDTIYIYIYIYIYIR